jgi:hypothetical protein
VTPRTKLISLILGGTVALAAAWGLGARRDSDLPAPPAAFPVPASARREDRVPAAPAADPEDELVKALLRELPPEIAQSPESLAIRDTALPNIENLLDSGKFDRTRLVEAALKARAALVSCLTQNGCSQKARTDHVYFDPTRTPAHRFLERSLALLRAAESRVPSDTEAYGVSEYLATAQIPSANIQKIGLDILRERRLTGSESIELLNSVPALRDDAAAYFFSEAQRLYAPQSPLRAKYVDAIGVTLAHAGDEAKFMLERLPQLELSESEFASVSRHACPLLKDRVRAPRTIHALAQYAEARGYAFAADRLCVH